MEFHPTIGLEVHAELATRTKMFCDSPNDPDETRPNVNVCPVCLAHPGTLPTINKEAVQHVLRVGAALGSDLADYSEFDRKSYFYPDIPKGFQISQYEHPLVSGGSLAGVVITRVHLEEDTARSTHAEGKSLVDFNRAGVPLMELVTEPVIHDAQTAGNFARELQLLLRTLGASHANLEKGEMRIEANISVSADEKFGTKVEVKNLNSFRSVERAITYEVARQSELVKSGGAVVQETRGWDESKQKTFSQRKKEGSADYRYFPEPDLPKLILSDIAAYHLGALQASLPELSDARRARYEEMGLKKTDAVFISSTLERSVFFDAVCIVLENDSPLVVSAANYFVSDLAGLQAKSDGGRYPAAPAYAALIRLIAGGKLSSRGGKEVLAALLERGGDPEALAGELGVLQMSDESALQQIVDAILEEHSSVVAEYRAGKEAALGYLVGQAMRTSKGAGNPTTLKKLILEKIGQLCISSLTPDKKSI